MTDQDPVSDEQWRCLFAPTTVAVIGASSTLGSWGNNVTRRLLISDRHIYPVNSSHSEILGVPAFKRIADIPDGIDLAVIAIPSERVADAMRQCVAKGVKAAVVISGGFSETDEQGKGLEQELVAVARSGGIRFIGPNTMGHSDTGSGLNLVDPRPIPGRVAFISQSGFMGTRILQLASQAGIGFSKFVSAGNEASIRFEDYLDYFSADENTRAILSYMEGLREARRFFGRAKDTTSRKPIVILKTGGTAGSSQAARSHTGALCGSPVVYDTAFRQTGVIAVDTEDEAADVLATLVRQPLPQGPRMAILTMGGGFGVTAAEACEREGLKMASLSQVTIDRINEMLPSRWPRANPVDLVGMDGANEQLLLSLLSTLVEDPGVDAVMSLLGLRGPGPSGVPIGDVSPKPKDTHASESRSERLRTFVDRARELGKTVLTVGNTPAPVTVDPHDPGSKGIPSYPNPHRAARALRRVLWYSRYLESRKEN